MSSGGRKRSDERPNGKENEETYYEAFRAVLNESKDKMYGGMDQCATHKGGNRGGSRGCGVLIVIHFGCVASYRVVNMIRGKVSHREWAALGPALPGLVNRKYFDLSTGPSEEREHTYGRSVVEYLVSILHMPRIV